jgi:lipoyl(octanoyl) transferase
MIFNVDNPQLLTDYQSAMHKLDANFRSVQSGGEDICWLLQHKSVITAGMSAHSSELLNHNSNIPVINSSRGGKYTYHGPGQRICYINCDLKRRYNQHPDIKQFVKIIENWIINTLATFNVECFIIADKVGVWTCQNDRNLKIASIGLRASRWVTTHGFAINICPDLSNFYHIIPCGNTQDGVCSLHSLGHNISIEQFDSALIKHCII